VPDNQAAVDRLPQLAGPLFLTDGGIETTHVFHEGLELPCFAAFDLLKDAAGEAALRKYFLSYVALAKSLGLGCVLETPTWRASSDWAAKIGWSAADLAAQTAAPSSCYDASAPSTPPRGRRSW
jgi:S-methylmethionine-dependent homocysteine/selenocysteine methylase